MATVYTSKEQTVRIGRQSSRPQPAWKLAMLRAARLFRTGYLETHFG